MLQKYDTLNTVSFLLQTDTMSMLVIDIETMGLKIETHCITVIGIILYDPVLKCTVRSHAFNVLQDEESGHTEKIVDAKNAVIKLMLECNRIVVFNGLRFDMPFIMRWLQQAPMPTSEHAVPDVYNSFPKKCVDFCADCFELAGNYVSLNNLCVLNKLDVCKSGDGAQAVVWAKQKKWKQLAEYCMQDVDVLLQLTQHALAHGLVFPYGRMFTGTMPVHTRFLSYDHNCEALREETSLVEAAPVKATDTKIFTAICQDIFEP